MPYKRHTQKLHESKEVPATKIFVTLSLSTFEKPQEGVTNIFVTPSLSIIEAASKPTKAIIRLRESA